MIWYNIIYIYIYCSPAPANQPGFIDAGLTLLKPCWFIDCFSPSILVSSYTQTGLQPSSKHVETTWLRGVSSCFVVQGMYCHPGCHQLGGTKTNWHIRCHVGIFRKLLDDLKCWKFQGEKMWEASHFSKHFAHCIMFYQPHLNDVPLTKANT